MAGTTDFVGGKKSVIPLDDDHMQPNSVKDGTPIKENEKQVHDISGSPYKSITVQAAVSPYIPTNNCFATLSKDENSEGEEASTLKRRPRKRGMKLTRIKADNARKSEIDIKKKERKC